MKNLTITLSILTISSIGFVSAQNLTDAPDSQVPRDTSNVGAQNGNNKTFWENLKEMFTGTEEQRTVGTETAGQGTAGDVATTTADTDVDLAREDQPYGGYEQKTASGNILTDTWEKTKKGAQDLFEGTKKAFTGNNQTANDQPAGTGNLYAAGIKKDTKKEIAARRAR